MAKLISYSLILSLLFVCTNTYCQRDKTNPIIYFEGFIGGALGKAPGFFIGEAINYQYKNNLFTVKASATFELGATIVPVVFLPIPVVEQETSAGELAVMYGYRTISKGHSYSFSLGVSINEFSQNRVDANNSQFVFQTNYAGLPTM